MLHPQALSARADFTKESLQGLRARIGDLPDAARLVPRASSSQAQLESLALACLAGPADGLAVFGIVETIPSPQRLDLRITDLSALRPLIEMLPSQERDKTLHGITDLRARPTGRGAIDIWLDGTDTLLHVWCRGVDLHPLLDDHEKQVTASNRRPQWTQAASAARSKPRSGRPRCSRRPTADHVPPTLTAQHMTSRYLASALLRRPGMWERLAGHQHITIVSEKADHGLDWHLQRSVAPGTVLHDDRLTLSLDNTLAGTGLVWDRADHLCRPDACRMTFIPRERDEGWDGILTVTTTPTTGQSSHPAARRPRPFAVLGETQTATGPAPRAVAPSRPRSRGRVLQLENVPQVFDRDTYTPWQFARQLAAAWALKGERALIIGSSRSPQRSRRLGVSWPRGRRRDAPRQVPWQPMCLVPGKGALYQHCGPENWEELEKLVAQARDQFDWILLADDYFNNHVCPPLIEGVADEYLLVRADPGFRTSLPVRHTHNPSHEVQVRLSPAEAAMIWREQTLRQVPFGTIPVSGLLLATAEHSEGPGNEEFVAEADRALARLGTPVIARFAACQVKSPRTVLDQEGDVSATALCKQAETVADKLGGAGANRALSALPLQAEDGSCDGRNPVPADA